MEKDTESDIDENKIDDAALALLYLTMHNDTFGTRAWKNIDWDVMDRLYEKGYISNPQSKAKSVAVTSEGEKRSKELFIKLFGSNK